MDMLRRVAPTIGTGQHYALALGELWPGVHRALVRLDAIAADPGAFDELELPEALARLQYHLHLGSEHVYGLVPPPGAETAHAELAAALAAARDATGEVADAVAEDGADALTPLLHEWRGALFRVRLARLRLATPAPLRPAAEEPPPEGYGKPLAAFLLALTGAVAFAGGATLGMWPIWLAGLLAVAGGIFTYRP
jgi:hypothetical protein